MLLRPRLRGRHAIFFLLSWLQAVFSTANAPTRPARHFFIFACLRLPHGEAALPHREADAGASAGAPLARAPPSCEGARGSASACRDRQRCLSRQADAGPRLPVRRPWSSISTTVVVELGSDFAKYAPEIDRAKKLESILQNRFPQRRRICNFPELRTV